MLVAQRKSKYKHKVTVPLSTTGFDDHKEVEMRKWCTQLFGEGGRNKNLRWRYGWTQKDITFYFRQGKDASMFLLRWT